MLKEQEIMNHLIPHSQSDSHLHPISSMKKMKILIFISMSEN